MDTLTIGGISGKRLDITVVIILNALGFLYAVLTRDLYIGSVLFSVCAVGIPSIIYLSLRKKKDWRKIFLFTLVFGVLYDALLLEFFAEATESWNVVNMTLPYRLFGIIPLDSIIGQGIISTCYIAVFYEHFFHNERSRQISSHITYAILLGVFLILGIYIAHFTDPKILKGIAYPYMFAGFAVIIAPIIFAYTHPVIFRRMALMGSYFFFLFMAFEIIGVNYSWWVFRGANYVGWVNVLNARFPFEEVFFWWLFYPATLIFFYEYFICDEKCLPHHAATT